jgi:hypothetical protein
MSFQKTAGEDILTLSSDRNNEDLNNFLEKNLEVIIPTLDT